MFLLRLQRGKQEQWKKYLEAHVTGYDKTIIMLAETIAESMEEKRYKFEKFEENLAESLIVAIKLCGIKTKDHKIANDMISQSLGILQEFWVIGWVLSEFSLYNGVLYHGYRIILRLP